LNSPGIELSFRNIPNAYFVHRKNNALACHDDLLLLAEMKEKLGPIIGMTPCESRVFEGFL
jgi:hypothetical protein